MSTLRLEPAVNARYAAGAQSVEPALCCPVQYNPELLKAIPKEVIERDYGCGDPSRFLEPGETVLDLGSGTGKICFLAAQVVGETGRVIGVDMTDEMLAVARAAAPLVAAKIGYANVEFRKGRIQDLGLDLERLEDVLKARPITDASSFLASEALAADLRRTDPLVATESVDVVVSNCVLNLVEPDAKRRLFDEIFRVLRVGGRAVISDIVSDEEVPEQMRRDPGLWSGCISGAFTESGFIDAFAEAGFHGIRLVQRDGQPWRSVQGIEFRALTVEAFKGKQGPCLEKYQAVIYKGPFKEVLDDDNHRLLRGRRHAVCDKTYQLYRKPPYAGCFEFVDPAIEIPHGEAAPFDCSRAPVRDPGETKGHGQPAAPGSRPCASGQC